MGLYENLSFLSSSMLGIYFSLILTDHYSLKNINVILASGWDCFVSGYFPKKFWFFIVSERIPSQCKKNKNKNKTKEKKKKTKQNKRIVKDNSILLFQHIGFQYNFSATIPYIYFLLVSIDSFILTLR